MCPARSFSSGRRTSEAHPKHGRGMARNGQSLARVVRRPRGTTQLWFQIRQPRGSFSSVALRVRLMRYSATAGVGMGINGQSWPHTQVPRRANKRAPRHLQAEERQLWSAAWALQAVCSVTPGSGTASPGRRSRALARAVARWRSTTGAKWSFLVVAAIAPRIRLARGTARPGRRREQSVVRCRDVQTVSGRCHLPVRRPPVRLPCDASRA